MKYVALYVVVFFKALHKFNYFNFTKELQVS